MRKSRAASIPLILTLAITLSAVHPAPFYTASAYAPTLPTQDCETNLASYHLSLDGKVVRLSIPFRVPGFTASSSDDIFQTATSVQYSPFFEVSLTALPVSSTELVNYALGVPRGETFTSYRQALNNARQAQNGVTQASHRIHMFEEEVQGITNLVFLNINRAIQEPVIIHEWVHESDGQLWILRISHEGEDDIISSALPDICIDVEESYVALQPVSPSAPQQVTLPSNVPQSPTDLPFPPWWNGDCDANNFPGSYPLGGVYNGVKACGPLNTAREVDFGVGVHQYEWQCPELSKRYLYLAYGTPPYSAHGKDVVWNYPDTDLEKISNGTSGKAPKPGSVLSYGPTEPYGHTSVVSASNVDSNGNGTITIIEQNWSSSGTRTHTVSNWVVQSSMTVSGWLYDPGGTAACAAPSLIAPTDNAILSDPTVTFRWDPVSGCTFNGYTFRVCTSPDVDNLSNCFIDTGEGSTERTETITGRNYQDLYWGVRAANAPAGANWAVRHFRIQPGEYPVRLYEHAGSGGRGLLFPQVEYGWWNLTDYDFNDIASSIEIDGGWSARLWLDTEIQPSNCQKCLNSGDSDFGGDYFDGGCGVSLNDQASSIEVFHNTSCTIPCPPPSAPNPSRPYNGEKLYPEDDLVFSWTGNASEYQAHWWGGPGGDHYSDWLSSLSWNVGQQWESANRYYWEVRGRNGIDCEGPWSGDQDFIIGPKAPSDLSTTAVSPNQINLSWSDNSTTESEYHVERSLDASSWQDIASVSGISHQDAGLNPSTTYYYRVRAHRDNDDAYSRYSNVAGATTESPPIEVVDPLSLSPADPLAGEEVTAALTISNSSGQELTLRRLVVGVRGPGCATWDCPNLADFPIEEYVTLQAGQEHTYLHTRVFPLAGDYLFEPLYEDMGSSWHSLGDQGLLSVAPGLEVVQALALTPSEPLAEQMVTAEYTMRNQGGRTISIERVGVVARGPDCSDWECPRATDFSGNDSVTLQPAQEYNYNEQRSFDVAGSGFFAEPAFMDANGWWYPFSGGNRVDFSVSPGVVLVHLVTLTPADPLAGEEVVASFAIRNGSDQVVTLRRLVLGVRGPGCPTWDCPDTADFFVEEYVTLSAGEEYTYNRSRVFPYPGEYLGDALYEDMDGYWHSLGNQGRFTVLPGLTVVQALTLLPSEPAAGQMVTAEYMVRNEGTRAISVEGLAVAGRGPDCSDLSCPNNVDFPLVSNVMLQSSQEYQYSQQRSFEVAGSGYLAEPTFMDSTGWWYPFDAGNRVTFSVASNPETGWLNLEVELQGRSDDSGATLTAWSGGQMVQECVTGIAGTCTMELPPGVYEGTVEMQSYLNGIWCNVSLVAGQSIDVPTVELRGGDINDDCVINILDLTPMGSHFGSQCGDPDWDPRLDINADCVLNIQDLAIAGGNFGRQCPDICIQKDAAHR